MSEEEQRTIVAAVATRLPSFWPANSQTWFIQVAVQFSKRGITSSHNYIQVYEEIVCALPTEYATKVQDIPFDPPNEEPYEKLKEQLIARKADLEHQNL